MKRSPAESIFLWNGTYFEAAKITNAWRIGARIFISYGRRRECLNHCDSAADARLVLSLLRKKIFG